MKFPIQNKCFNFKTRLINSICVKCLVQTLRPSVAMATNLSVHFYIYFQTYSSLFVLKLSIPKQEPLTHGFSQLDSKQNLYAFTGILKLEHKD